MLIILFHYLRISLAQFVYISDFQIKDIFIKPKNLIPNIPSLNR